MKRLADLFESRNLFQETSFDSMNRILRPLGAYSERELSKDLPILTPENKWEQLENPNRIRRKFLFKTLDSLLFFVGDLLEYERDIQHEGMIKILGNNVTVEVYTHDVNDITELDIEYAREADGIYADSKSSESK